MLWIMFYISTMHCFQSTSTTVIFQKWKEAEEAVDVQSSRLPAALEAEMADHQEFAVGAMSWTICLFDPSDWDLFLASLGNYRKAGLRSWQFRLCLLQKQTGCLAASLADRRGGGMVGIAAAFSTARKRECKRKSKCKGDTVSSWSLDGNLFQGLTRTNPSQMDRKGK